MKTIDITPTWSSLLPSLLAILANEKASFESRKVVTEELTRMAGIADTYIAQLAQQKEH